VKRSKGPLGELPRLGDVVGRAPRQEDVDEGVRVRRLDRRGGEAAGPAGGEVVPGQDHEGRRRGRRGDRQRGHRSLPGVGGRAVANRSGFVQEPAA
jgi:hypothetical protein